jgi:hypothetical protein
VNATVHNATSYNALADPARRAHDREDRRGLAMTTEDQQSRAGGQVVFAAITVGALVAVALGIYGRAHDPTGEAIVTFGLGGLAAMKVYLSVIVGVLAVFQLFTALWMYGRLGLAVPRGLGVVHRVSGAAAILVSLPVAYHCLWSLGFQTTDTRVVIHSVAGCVVYGAFVAKLVGLHARHAPGWLIPVAAGLVLAGLVAVIATGAGWYVDEFGWPNTSTGY